MGRPRADYLLVQERPGYASAARLWRDFERNIGNIGDPTVTTASTRSAKTKGELLVPFPPYTPARTDDGLQIVPNYQNYVSQPSNLGAGNGFWQADNCPVVVDQAANFDGSITMDKLLETADSGAHHVRNYAIMSGVAGNKDTINGYALAGERNWLRVNPSGTGMPVGANTFFNLSTGAVNQGVDAGTFGRMALTADGRWYWELVTTCVTTASIGVQLGISTNGSDIVYVGDPTKGIYVGGVNFRQGAFGLPPVTGAATVAGDQAVYDLAGRLDVSAGVALVASMDVLEVGSAVSRLFEINDGTGNNVIYAYMVQGTQTLVWGGSAAGVVQALSNCAMPAGGRTVVAAAYSAGFMKVRCVGYADPAAQSPAAFAANLNKLSPLGRGYDAARNSYGMVDKFAAFDGPMNQSRWDNQIWPAALAMAAAA